MAPLIYFNEVIKVQMLINVPISDTCKTHLRELLGDSLVIREDFDAFVCGHDLKNSMDFVRSLFDYSLCVSDDDPENIRLIFYSAAIRSRIVDISVILARDEFNGKSVTYIDETWRK